MRPWPADQLERWPIERLTPYPNNARIHNEADRDKIGAAILKWGWTMPVLVDEEGALLAGEARVHAAAKLQLTSIPVIVARGWSEEEKRAYRLADNQLAARASWDPERLSNELRDLDFAGFNLDLIGFEPDRLQTILAGLGCSGLTDPDSIPQAPEKPVTQLGDIWLLGPHRIGCGDSTSAADVEQVLAGSQPHLMVADPPYGVGYDPSWRARRGLAAGSLAQGKVLNDHRANWRDAYAVHRGCRLCLARGFAWRRRRRRSGGLRVAAARSDHLGQAALHLGPRRLSLEARMLLLRRPRGQIQPLAGRPHANHGVGNRQQQSLRQSASASRVGGMAPKSRSSAYAGRSSTTAGPASWSMTRFSARARL